MINIILISLFTKALTIKLLFDCHVIKKNIVGTMSMQNGLLGYPLSETTNLEL